MDKLNTYITMGISWVKNIFHLVTEWISSFDSFDYFLVFFLCFINIIIIIYLFLKVIKGRKGIKKNKPIVTKQFLDRVKGVDLELNPHTIASENVKNLDVDKLNKENTMQLAALQELLDGNFINKNQYNIKAEEIKKQT